jgi:NAD(P)-dependent dehydrogenase (short-subunit alcohol dehydrogenase family)
LDVLVNNAGGIFSPRRESEDGIEYTFALNHLAYFLLTNLLLDLLKSGGRSRVVNVSSDAHTAGHIDFDDLVGMKRYFAQRAYAQSKLANVLFTYELARRIEGDGVTVNAVHPGVVRTNFGSTASTSFRLVVKMVGPFMRSPEKGAETVIYLASSKDVEGVTGKYFYDKKEIRSIRESYDLNVAKRLWETSEELTRDVM